MKAELRDLARHQANLYRVLSNATRLRILWTLADQELSVTEIAGAAETSLQNTSQHLHLMQDKGILTSRREAQTIYYRIADSEPGMRCRELLTQTRPSPGIFSIDIEELNSGIHIKGAKP